MTNANPQAHPIIVSRGSDHALGEWGDHLIGAWDGAVSVPSVRTWSKRVQALVKAKPGKVVYVSYELGGFQMPSDEVRRVITETLRAIDGGLAACAVILPGTGFASAAVRALTSGLALVARPKTPLASVATIDEAHAWVARAAPQIDWPSAAAFREAIRLLEANVGAAR